MSPEQARGKALDARTDIWAFGCVLFEMLTGRVAFGGETFSDTIGAILHKEPEWPVIPAATPDHVVRLLRRCLQKDPKRRLRHIGDAALELQEPTVVRGPSLPAPRRTRAALMTVTVFSLLLATALALDRFRGGPVTVGGWSFYDSQLPRPDLLLTSPTRW